MGYPTEYMVEVTPPRCPQVLVRVTFPDDVRRFRVQDDEDAFLVRMRIRGRWAAVQGAFARQRGWGSDPDEWVRYDTLGFARNVLKSHGVRPWRKGRK